MVDRAPAHRYSTVQRSTIRHWTVFTPPESTGTLHGQYTCRNVEKTPGVCLLVSSTTHPGSIDDSWHNRRVFVFPAQLVCPRGFESSKVSATLESDDKGATSRCAFTRPGG